MTAPTVLLMLKAPVEGAVKTRLGQDIGPAAATRAYRALVAHQLRQVPPGWPIRVCYTPAGALTTMREWLGDECEYAAQAGGDLGERLAAAAEDHFRTSENPLVIVGGDCPYLSGERLSESAAALESADAVIVPSVDGGYCLLALRRADADLFRAISWSTDAVLAQTRLRLRERGLTWTELETTEDVDDAASWQRARLAFPQLAVSAP